MIGRSARPGAGFSCAESFRREMALAGIAGMHHSLKENPFERPEEALSEPTLVIGCHDECLFLTRFLTKRGYRIAFAAGSEDAWDMLRAAEAPRLLIVDYEVRGAISMCRRLRADASAPSPYILMLTPKPGPLVMLRAFESGADDCIVKPFIPRQLDAKLKIARRVLRLEKQLETLREELGRASRYDDLTALLNRATVLEQLDNDRERALREQTSLGLMVVDIDHFKQINDTLGHLAGDQVLAAIGNRLRSQTRLYDSVGRYGGDEFIVIMPGAGQKELEHRAEMIRESIATLSLDCGSSMLSPTVSIGLSVLNPRSPASCEQLFKLADSALYQAKGEGRNRIAFSSEISL
jgi:two-component system cell cycle response regulator